MFFMRILVNYSTFNMKYFIDGVIVVEGTNDSSFLSSFVDALYVETNGFDIDEQEIDFLQDFLL